MFTILRTLIASLLIIAHTQASDTHFAVVVPSYNNELWVQQNLQSLATQDYSNWSLYYINDCSTDQTGKRAEELVKELHLKSKTTLIHNTERHGALANIYNTVQQCKPHDVIVLLDGDDRLAHSTVLSHLAHVYADSTVWMTYGSFVCDPPGGTKTTCESIPEKVARKNRFRKHSWVTSHLRTFYAKLFHLIKKEDLLWEGEFFPTTWDLAIMFPLLEMASHGHYKYIQEVLYVYNTQNPLMDRKIHGKLQRKLGKYIRAKERYQPIDTLF